MQLIAVDFWRELFCFVTPCGQSVVLTVIVALDLFMFAGLSLFEMFLLFQMFPGSARRPEFTRYHSEDCW